MRKACALAVAALLAGCGGGDERLSKAQYQRELSEVGKTLSESIGSVGGAVTGVADLEAAGEQVGELQTALSKAADDLDELEPPEDVEGAHEKLVQGIRGFADELEDLEIAIRGGDLGRIRTFENDFGNSEPVAQIREASEELEEQGYELE
jgi:hypothetical protein